MGQHLIKSEKPVNLKKNYNSKQLCRTQLEFMILALDVRNV